jgi:hypothetical protein
VPLVQAGDYSHEPAELWFHHCGATMNTLLDLDSPELNDEVRKRLSAILRDYACPPTSEGWRMLLFILLSSQKHSQFQAMKGQLSGIKNHGALLSMVHLMHKRPELKQIDAANEVANDKTLHKHPVKSKTLQNQFAKLRDRDSSEVQLTPTRASKRFEALWNALNIAATQLEQSYTGEPYYDAK